MSRQIHLLLHVDTHVAEAHYQDMQGQPSRHEALLDAIRCGDGDAAASQARAHIDAVAERVIAVLRLAEARQRSDVLGASDNAEAVGEDIGLAPVAPRGGDPGAP
jgi:DNA-binding FadR family transcriptional regulator